MKDGLPLLRSGHCFSQSSQEKQKRREEGRGRDWLMNNSFKGLAHAFKEIVIVQLLSHVWLFVTPWTAKASILWRSASFMVQLSHPYMTTGKTIALTRQTFVGKVMSLLFNMLSRFVMIFLPRSKCLFNFMAAVTIVVILEPRKIKSVTVSIVSSSICHEMMGPAFMILVFWMLSFKSAFSLYSFTFIKRLFSSSLPSAIRVLSLHIWGYWYFSQESWFHLVFHPA